jgi:hypothetical protein
MISGVLLDPRTGRPIVDRRLRAQLEERGWERVVENLERSRRGFFAAERNPPLFMDVSSAYSGDELGLPYRDIVGEGIVAVTDLAVTGQAGANSVNIAKGAAWVVGDTNVDLQPTYRVFNDAIVNLGISPDPALARRVHVIGQVVDQGFAGSGRVWSLQALHGTPNAAPVLPALPASAISLANVLVPAAAATSGVYTFTDTRARAAVGGGSLPLGGLVPAARVFHSVAQATANNVVLVLAFDSERYDTDTLHDPVTNNSRLTCKTAGKYSIKATIGFDANVTGMRQVDLMVNGVTVITNEAKMAVTVGGVPTYVTATADYELAVGDYVTCRAFQNSGGALNVLAGAAYSPEFSMARIA